MAKGVVLSPVVARKVKRLIDRDGEGNGRASVQGVALDFADRAFPFMVRWSATLNTWICYIPDVALVYIGDKRYGIGRSGLTAAGAPYPSGWYKVASGSENTVYLNLWGDPSGPSSNFVCSLTREEGEDREGFKRYTFEIAIIRSYTNGEKSVVQLINSAIFIGGVGGKKLRGGEYTNLVVDDSDPEYTTVDVFYKV